jgi:Uma2 family endonuclease
MKNIIHNEDSGGYLGYPPLIVHLQPVFDLTDDQLYEFSQINRDLRIERNAKGELIIMPPTAGDTGERNAEITMQLRLWSKRDGSGVTFDSSTGFRLPNGAVRSPDASWIKKTRLTTLSAEERKKFIPLCPDFVIELRSASDNLNTLQDKIQEYIDNGTNLAWLIDPEQKQVYVYNSQGLIKELKNPDSISADPILPGFVLNLNEVW